jgi:hypothetical protein
VDDWSELQQDSRPGTNAEVTKGQVELSEAPLVPTLLSVDSVLSTEEVELIKDIADLPEAPVVTTTLILNSLLSTKEVGVQEAPLVETSLQVDSQQSTEEFNLTKDIVKLPEAPVATPSLPVTSLLSTEKVKLTKADEVDVTKVAEMEITTTLTSTSSLTSEQLQLAILHAKVTIIEVKSSTTKLWNVVGAERTSTTPNRIVI